MRLNVRASVKVPLNVPDGAVTGVVKESTQSPCVKAELPLPTLMQLIVCPDAEIEKLVADTPTPTGCALCEKPFIPNAIASASVDGCEVEMLEFKLIAPVWKAAPHVPGLASNIPTPLLPTEPSEFTIVFDHA